MLTPSPLGVVVPTRNSAATLLSLMSQQRLGVEVVVVDSESTDETLGICGRWGVRALTSPPGNMYRAINVGMRALSACDWLTYLNSDDFVYADGYARLVEPGARLGLDVVYGNGDFTDQDGAFIFSQTSFGPSIVCRQLAAGTMPFVQPAAVFRRDVFHQLHGFDERFTQIADYDFYARAAAAGFRFGTARGRAVAAFRVHDRQLSTVHKAIVDREKALRRRECGRYRRFARMGWSAIWKVRNTANYLGWIAQRAESRSPKSTRGCQRAASSATPDTGHRTPDDLEMSP
jgi:glycosyltransferase involved in cell wall biosynthesis